MRGAYLKSAVKLRTILLSLTLCFLSAASCLADNSMLGTWKLNESKSKMRPGAPKGLTAVYELVGDDVKITLDGVASSGKPTHSEWTGKFDGKYYPVTGNGALVDARSYTKVDDRTLVFSEKKNGKVVFTGRVVISKDGKSRAVTTNGTDPKGKKFRTVYVYDKQP